MLSAPSPLQALAAWGALAALFAIAAILGWQWSGASANWLAHTLIVQQQLSKTLIAVQDAETGHRGYVLTGDETYLEPYNRAKAELPSIYGALGKLVRDNDDQATHANDIIAAVQERLTILEAGVDAMRAGRVAEAQDMVKSGKGRAAMDRLRAMIAEAQREEQQLFDQRQSRYQLQRFWFLAALLATLVGCAGLALITLLQERNRVAALETSAEALATLNKSLEDRVAARTAELGIERDRAEAERERAEALLRDVTHRIGNTLSLVVGFINLHIRHARDPMSIRTLTGARSRIHAIASAQRRINVTSDLDFVRIDDLVPAVLSDLIAATGASAVELDVRIPPLLAPAQAATSICVLTQEFVMNSLKHAFPGGRKGLITVALDRAPAGGAILTISDDGVGMQNGGSGDGGAGDGAGDGDGDEEDDDEGLGSKIATLLTRQFNGSITYGPARASTDAPGAKVVVTLPDLKLAVADEEQPAA